MSKLHVPFMLDSGAFSAWSLGGSVDFDEYVKYVKRLIRSYPNCDLVYINLDRVGDGEYSYCNWLRMRDLGLNPLPVYHVNVPERYLAKYLELTDYVALGNLAFRSNKKRQVVLDSVWQRYFLDDKSMPKVRVHGLGLASFRLMERYPWYSIDSTSWLRHASVGALLIPKPTEGQYDFRRTPFTCFVTGPKMQWRGKRRYRIYLNPEEIDYVRSYVQACGCEIEGDDGVRHSWSARYQVNVYYFHRFMKERLSWPRRFAGAAVRTLL